MTRLYTGGGDGGTTSLLDGTRVQKDDPRIDLNGTLDEAQAAIGMARSMAPGRFLSDMEELEHTLFLLMAYVARGDRNISSPSADLFEKKIDGLESLCPHDRSFVKPGKSPSGAALHLARTIARRAEREALPLLRRHLIDEDSYRLINRLSDYIFALAVACDEESMVEEITRKVIKELIKMSCKEGEGRLSLKTALDLMSAAEDRASQISVPMAITVSDEKGPLVFHRMDGVLPVSVGLSGKKAKTSLELRKTTSEVYDLVQPGAPLYGLQSDPDLCCFGGGIPLTDKEGRVVGAVGVSGGSVEEDIEVAEAVVSLWKEKEVR